MMKDEQMGDPAVTRITDSPEDTEGVGRRLASDLRGGDVVLLLGSIGAGKSVMARGIAAGLGATAWRGSPTFNLIHEYESLHPLYHADLYRLAENDVESLGLQEYARPDSILMVEWADRAEAYLSRLAHGRTLRVEIDHVGMDERLIALHWRASGAMAQGGATE